MTKSTNSTRPSGGLTALLNPSAETHALPVRLFRVVALCFLMLWKALHLPRCLDKRGNNILKHWTWSQYFVFVRTLGKTVYIDQPCFLPPPEQRSRPDVEVSAEYRLTQAELERFEHDGFIGPFPCFSQQELDEFRPAILDLKSRDSSIYGFPTDRDRHLEFPKMLEMMRRPEITERLAQLLGPDLVCWRSQVFHKPCGGEKIQWHQASTYLFEDYQEPALQPADRDPMFQLTVWIAIDDATEENGCIEFAPNTQDCIRTMTLGGTEGFYEAKYQFDYTPSPEDVVKVPVPRGHFIVFCERTVHGSGPNLSEHPRCAFNFRVIPPHVPVYKNKRIHKVIHLNQTYDLEQWGVTQIRGTDPVGVNRHFSASSPNAAAERPGRKREPVSS